MRRAIGIIGGLVVVLVALGLVASLWLMSPERVAGMVERKLTAATGREVTIGGEVELRYWPVLGLSAGEFTIGNAEWAGEKPLLSTRRASIGVNAAALLGGDVRVTEITAQSPTIRLASRADGRANWQFGEGAAPGDGEEGAKTTRRRPLSIEQIEISNATLIHAVEGAPETRVDGVDIAFDWADRDGPATLVTGLSPAGAPLEWTAKIDSFAAFLGGGAQPVETRLTTPGGALSLKGRGTLKGALGGNLSLEADDLGAFLGALGLADLAPPPELGQEAALTAQMTLSPDRQLALRDMEGTLGENTLRGRADLRLEETPKVSAEINLGDLDLRALASRDTAARPQTSDEEGYVAPAQAWSDAPIDVSALGAFEGEIALAADSMSFPALTLGATKLRLTNDDARMVLALEEIAAYGGALTGEFVMNNRNGLSVGGDLRATAMEVGDLLADTAGVERFGGSGDATLSFLGVGESVAEIMRSLRGQGRVDMGQGTIAGLDLDALLGSEDVPGGSTVFDSLTAGFKITDGVLRNDDLALLLPNFSARGRGDVNIGARSLDYTIIPKSLRGNGGRGIAVPVRITGPWDDPDIRLDLDAAISLNLREERQRQKTQAEDALEEQLETLRERAGKPRQKNDNRRRNRRPARDLEEVLKDEVEKRLKRELLKIFD